VVHALDVFRRRSGYRAEAERCRRIPEKITDRPTGEAVRRVAEDHEHHADALQGQEDRSDDQSGASNLYTSEHEEARIELVGPSSRSVDGKAGRIERISSTSFTDSASRSKVTMDSGRSPR